MNRRSSAIKPSRWKTLLPLLLGIFIGLMAGVPLGLFGQVQVAAQIYHVTTIIGSQGVELSIGDANLSPMYVERVHGWIVRNKTVSNVVIMRSWNDFGDSVIDIGVTTQDHKPLGTVQIKELFQILDLPLPEGGLSVPPPNLHFD